jgi:hypothetical protein
VYHRYPFLEIALTRFATPAGSASVACAFEFSTEVAPPGSPADRGVVAWKSYLATAALLLGTSASALSGAPMAAASGADATIADLQAQGYLVQINWVNGATKSLSQCTVTGVNNPSSSPPKPGDTVYVDVRCPNHEDDDGHVGIGIGIG